MSKEVSDAIYTLSGALRDRARQAARRSNIDEVHYFVSQARKVDRMDYQINRMFPENNS